MWRPTPAQVHMTVWLKRNRPLLLAERRHIRALSATWFGDLAQHCYVT
jgi:hypothetical protein